MAKNPTNMEKTNPRNPSNHKQATNNRRNPRNNKLPNPNKHPIQLATKIRTKRPTNKHKSIHDEQAGLENKRRIPRNHSKNIRSNHLTSIKVKIIIRKQKHKYCKRTIIRIGDAILDLIECSQEHISKIIECCNGGKQCGILARREKEFINIKLTCPDNVACELIIFDKESLNMKLEDLVNSITLNKINYDDLVVSRDDNDETFLLSRP